LDSWLANGATLQDPPTVWVDSIDPDVIEVEWFLNGQSLDVFGETLSIISLGALGIGPGSYQLSARSHDRILDHAFTGDALDWWRLPDTSPLRQTIDWSVVITPPTGDFDRDGDYDCLDVDGLTGEIVAQSNNLLFDLTGDGSVNVDDLTDWRVRAGAVQLPGNAAYLPADANLDGVVDTSDFNLWNAHKFTAVARWCAGDFTADGLVDGSDFNLWNGFKFLSSAPGLVVPEPRLAWIGLVGLVASFASTRQRR
ncbi:MAG TPA: hypothetical protein VIY86_14055, partial [Pirellulaceae bacterium]